MKIAIDLTALYGRHYTGIEYYAIDLYKALMDTDHEIVPIVHVSNEIDDNPNTYVIPKRFRLWLENISLSMAVRKIKADVVFFPVFPPPVDIYFGTRSRIVKVVHDLVHFKYRHTLPFAAKYYYTPKIWWMLRNADVVMTISDTVRNELSDFTHKKVVNCGEDIAVTFRGAGEKALISDLEQFGLTPGGYYVSVSTIEPRKNLKYLLRTLGPVLRATGRRLVLVGKRRPAKDAQLAALLDEWKDYVVFTGYVSEEIMFSLYRHAHAFILLSIYEGFGRTPFEAVACGCRRIILSDIPVFRETFDGNAMFVPLDNPHEATAMLRADDVTPVRDGFQVPFDVLKTRVKEFLDSYAGCQR